MPPSLSRIRLSIAVLAAAVLAGGAWEAGAQSASPRVSTQQSYAEEIGRSGDFDITDPLAVFRFVFAALPEQVKVYPTENYYYFAFHHGGVRYAGNIRLENETRDTGKVHFAYAVENAPWKADDPLFRLLVDASHGLAVERADALTYRLTLDGKTVTFALNDLSGVRPPPEALASGERFIGPVFDESGIRFFLVFDPALKLFRYVLDETVAVADVLAPSEAGERVLVGKRTGFVFYRDHRLARKILIGVFARNADLNTWFDGPFDQLPDNFIVGETLREAIVAAEPSLQGKIDRFGSAPDKQVRYAIAPYRHYDYIDEFVAADRCAARRQARDARYYACFDVKAARAGGGATSPPSKRTPPTRR